MSEVWYIRTPAGFVNLLAALVTTAAVLACGLRWTATGDVFLQLVFADFEWQTAVMIALLICFVIVVGVLVFRIGAHKERLARLTKAMVIGLFSVCLAASVFVAAVEVWYLTRSNYIASGQSYNRVVAIMIMSVIMSLLYMILLALAGCFFQHFVPADY